MTINDNNLIINLPLLPNSLSYLDCSSNQLTSIFNFPISLKQLNCGFNQLISLPQLPASLREFACWNNNLISLPALPDSLLTLTCAANQLTDLPLLPNYIYSLDFQLNQISNIDNLPLSLQQLSCSYNLLSTLPPLPNSLTLLYCSYNQLSNMPNLPVNLIYLDCGNNDLTELPILPNSLSELYCENNFLSSLPILPNTLGFLNCNNNLLINLPNLPNTLLDLYCSTNQLSSLPLLPASLRSIDCSFNQLTNLSNFSDLLTAQWGDLICNNNNISCFSTFPFAINTLIVDNNPFNCLPNYINAMGDSLLNIPLCIENDPINNPSGCNPALGITGTIYADTNSNCVLENSEMQLINFPVKLYSSDDSLIRQTYSLSNGMYQFPQEAGAYKVKIDTLGKPYSIQCQNLDSTIILDSQNPLADSVNFALICKPGFDVGVQSVLTSGWVFPGQNHELQIIAGDMSNWFNMNCAAGIGGEVQISISGPVNYISTSNGVLIPTIFGNTYTYSISDFGNIDFQNSFGLIFQTDTTAKGGDEICVSINVTPTNGDNNMSNNTFEYCYQVVNSYDPNMKEVYPVNVEPGYEDYFTYTIHFQNTGSAPAFNIRLLDTLDSNLDLETFQVINYSHYNSAMLKNNVLTFHFPNIMLPDSTTNLEGSKGFVQYRIKPKANLPLGTQIKNTANIYFDFNAPIVTNTTVNEFQETNSISEKETKIMNVFPNPFSNSATLIFKSALQNIDLVLYNVYGQKVKTISNFSGNKLKLERENLSTGIYYLNLESEGKMTEIIKLIIAD